MELEAETLAPAAPMQAHAGDELLGAILAEARHRGAGKIHFEPQGGGVTVRFRIAGVLVEALRLPEPAASEVMALVRAGGLLEATVSKMPTEHGPRAVLHLRSTEPPADVLAALGMRPALVRALGAGLARGGLVLVAAPPGCGRTTTLRAFREHLDNGTRCVIAADAGDPGAFAAALTQDPDVLLAGTIEDRAAAAAAVRAAEAGHLVLAGIDATDAIGAILKLRALRVEPFQLASTLQAVIAQRLVRRLCPECREPVQAAGSVTALLGFDPGAVVYAPVGCDACAGEGYAGRTGVFEAIHADAALRRLINDGGDGAIIARHAFLNAPNLGSAARALVRGGITTPDEAVRVSRS